MMSRWLSGLVVLAVLSPVVAAAQAPPSGDVEIERKQRRAIVLPKPPADQVRSDAERAVNEYLGRSPSAVVRETSPVNPPSRPDLGSDIQRGIQSDRVNRELFRR